MAFELAVSMQNTVGGRVVTSSVHGIRASLVERGLAQESVKGA